MTGLIPDGIHRVGVLGKSGYGKTTALRWIAAQWTQAGRPVAVYDPFPGEGTWPTGSYSVAQHQLVLAMRRAGEDHRLAGLGIIIDEIGDLGRHYPELGTQSRHYRCPVAFGGQRYSQVTPNIRHQWTALLMFNQSPADLKVMQEEHNLPPEVYEIADYRAYEYACIIPAAEHFETHTVPDFTRPA